MELKEYIKIIKTNYKLFILIIAITISASLLFFYTRPVSYDVSLIVNVTRNGSSASAEYNYGGFYRLQADEKFAETIVRWLKSPRVAQDIMEKSGLGSEELSVKKLSKVFKADKMSSQIVSVYFSSPNEEQALRISKSILDIISQNTANLNESQKEKDWFKIVAFAPTVIKNQINFKLALFFSAIAGIFLAFWVVLLVYYFKE